MIATIIVTAGIVANILCGDTPGFCPNPPTGHTATQVLHCHCGYRGGV